MQLTEWKVELSSASVPAGPVRFIVHNGGNIPHGFESRRWRPGKEIELISPGASDTLEVTLKAGHYEIYCPVGGDSHKKLGMDVEFTAAGVGTTGPGMAAEAMTMPVVKAIAVEGGGPVIQILPGPFPSPTARHRSSRRLAMSVRDSSLR